MKPRFGCRKGPGFVIDFGVLWRMIDSSTKPRTDPMQNAQPAPTDPEASSHASSHEELITMLWTSSRQVGGLVALLRSAEPGTVIEAEALAVLLHPAADQLEQALGLLAAA
ncbi:MAG: hypothetical protein C0423_13970 [Methylibium sp.]|nr:hypothetical protein [Methylibium sp.]